MEIIEYHTFHDSLYAGSKEIQYLSLGELSLDEIKSLTQNTLGDDLLAHKLPQMKLKKILWFTIVDAGVSIKRTISAQTPGGLYFSGIVFEKTITIKSYQMVRMTVDGELQTISFESSELTDDYPEIIWNYYK